MEYTQVKLQHADKYMPKDYKRLAACAHCKLIQDDNQWQTLSKCPNCGMSPDPRDFSGMISMMMPAESWVAKWNNVTGKMPGIYAMHVKDMGADDKLERQLDQEKSDEDLDDFIVGDGQDEESYDYN